MYCEHIFNWFIEHIFDDKSKCVTLLVTSYRDIIWLYL